MNRLKDEREPTHDQNGNLKSGIKAYSKGFGIGILFGVAVCIYTPLKGFSIILLFACLFGAIGYQLKMKQNDSSK